MRILVQGLTASPGGSINVLANLLRDWPTEDDIACFTWRQDMVPILRMTGHQVIRIDARSTPMAMRRLITDYRRKIERWQPDILFSQEYAVPRVRTPQVVHHQNILRFQSFKVLPPTDMARDVAVAATLHRSAISLFNSHTLREAALNRWPRLRHRRTAVVHNPIDTNDFERIVPRRDPQQVRVVVPQGDWDYKRNDLAVDVLDRLIRHLRAHGDSRRVQMTFVGTGAYSSVRAAAERLNLAREVSILGYIPRPDLAAIYASSDIALITSLKESFCNPVVEAHAAGLPIVTTPLPIFNEISGPLSLTAGGYTAEALTASLVEGLNRSPTQAGRREAALHFASRFDSAAKARELRALLESAAGNRS